VDDGGSIIGWGASSVYGLFSSSENTTTTTINNNNNNSSSSVTDANSESSDCPFPTAFLQKRQKELFSYYTCLNSVPDIFEFGDVHSHKFGTVMAAFLGVDKVLLARKNTSAGAALPGFASDDGHQPQHPSSRSAFPAIDENETTDITAMFDPSSLQPPTPSVPTRLIDDDVSILSDGTFNTMAGSKYVDRGSFVRGSRPQVVDFVPQHHATGSGGNGDASEGNEVTKEQQPASSDASISDASGSRRRRSTAAAAPRAKTAPVFNHPRLGNALFFVDSLLYSKVCHHKEDISSLPFSLQSSSGPFEAQALSG